LIENASGPPEPTQDKLVSSALALLVSNGLSAALGVVFWVVTAHLFRPVDVGYGVAEIAAMTLIASVSQFSPAVVFQRFLYAAGSKAGTVLRVGYFAVIGIALTVGIGFLVFTGHHVYLSNGLTSSLIFLGAVVLWVIFSVEDSALIGLRNTVWVPIENISFSAAKILMLPIFAIFAPHNGVFAAWIVPVIGCVIPINYFLFFKVLPRHVAASKGHSLLPSRKVIGSILAGEYLGGLALIAMTTLPALFIVGRLGAVQAAYFQTPWLAGISFDFSLWSIAAALTAETGARPSSAVASVRKAIRMSLLLLGPSVVILVIGAPYFLDLLGKNYARHGTELLRSLVLAIPFMGVNVLYVTFARMARRVRRVVALQLSLAAIELVLTGALIGPMGITGAGVAFLIGQGVVAIAVLPSVTMQYRRDHMSPGFALDSSLVVTLDTRKDFQSSPMSSPDATSRFGGFLIQGKMAQPETDVIGDSISPWLSRKWRLSRRRKSNNSTLEVKSPSSDTK